MRKITLIILTLTISLPLLSHPWKPAHYVIIDTDGGIDDMRAISMMLASPDVRVLAVTVSPGVLSADEVYIKVKSLLNSFHHEGIPVGVNRTSKFKSPEFPVAAEAVWGEENGLNSEEAPGFISLINEILANEPSKISFVCLGGLSTTRVAMKELPVFRQQVKEIIWSATGPDNKSGFNYNIDKQAADNIIKEDIPVHIVHGLGDKTFYS
jgi:pyrimidine-specific ribonucleoside hydrolase